jgi:hypothetical protein
MQNLSFGVEKKKVCTPKNDAKGGFRFPPWNPLKSALKRKPAGPLAREANPPGGETRWWHFLDEEIRSFPLQSRLCVTAPCY